MRLSLIRFLAIAGFALASSTVVYAQTPRATITLDNQSGEPAVVKLVGPTGRLAEVPNGQKRTVKVTGGEYHIVTRYGSTPDRYTYSKGDAFRVVQTSTQYSMITITLHKIVDGNYHTHPITAAEFERSNQ